jgi:three-Cys-motif partner protein
MINEYAAAYSLIIEKQRDSGRFFDQIYIDAFAGAGVHISERTGGFVDGSPVLALKVEPAFHEYHFIDLDGERTELLRILSKARDNVYVHHGDCNKILVREVFPRASYQDFKRALCVLDPYGLDLDWEVIRTAGAMRSIEIFVNFPVMDMNRNVLWIHPEGVDPSDAARMDAFWGDPNWRGIAYDRTQNLFGYPEKQSNECIAAAYQDRLRHVAGFSFVPEPIPMRNSRGAIVYYLFFASPNKTGGKIVGDIFGKYKERGKVHGR